MEKYSIKNIASITGVKAHTIRIWEKRYNLFKPERTNTNIRFYDEEDLKKILNIVTLYNQGYKISKIALLSDSCLKNELLKINSEEHDLYINQLVIVMIEMNENEFERIFNKTIRLYGFEKTMLEVIYPFLKKTGILWLSNNINPAQEHFISNLIRQKIIVAIDNLSPNYRINKTVILFLPEGEMHEIGLLFYHYLIKKRGYKTLYLGQNVPLDDLLKAVEHTNAETVFGMLSYIRDDEKIIMMINYLEKKLTSQSIILAGKPILKLKNKISKSIKILDNPLKLNNYLL